MNMNKGSDFNLTWSGVSRLPVSNFRIIIERDRQEIINTQVKPSQHSGFISYVIIFVKRS